MDRRAFPRAALHLRVDFKDQGAVRAAMLANISGGGVYIETPHQKALNTRMLLTMRLPDGQDPVNVEVRVVWINSRPSPESKLGPGMGLKFENLSHRDLKRIEKLVEVSPKVDY